MGTKKVGTKKVGTKKVGTRKVAAGAGENGRATAAEQRGRTKYLRSVGHQASPERLDEIIAQWA